MFTRVFLRVFLLLCFFHTLCQADVSCNGTSDYLYTSAILTDVMSASTGSWVVTYKPVTVGTFGGANCDNGEHVFGIMDYPLAIYRHGDRGGVHSACGFHYATSGDTIDVAHTADTWVQIAFVHSGGNIFLYKDGVAVGSTASGNTAYTNSILRLCKNANAYSFPLLGVIADAQVFPTALSAGEIAAIGKSRIRNITRSVSSGSWPLHSCADGADCTSQTFGDSSGNGRIFTAASANGKASEAVGYPWGVE